MSGNDWYSNKDLFEQITALRIEMKETRALIKSYNGLREEVEEVKKKLDRMEAISKGKSKAGDNINRWVLFGFAFISIAITLINFFK